MDIDNRQPTDDRLTSSDHLHVWFHSQTDTSLKRIIIRFTLCTYIPYTDHTLPPDS